MIKCAQCGYENDDHNLFCSYCNFGLNNIRRKPAAPETPPVEEQQEQPAETEDPNTETIEEKVTEEKQSESPDDVTVPESDADEATSTKTKKPAAKRKTSSARKKTTRRTAVGKSEEPAETVTSNIKPRTQRKRRKTNTGTNSTTKRNGKLTTEKEIPTQSTDKAPGNSPKISDTPSNGTVSSTEKKPEPPTEPIPLGPATIPMAAETKPESQRQTSRPLLQETGLSREPIIRKMPSPKKGLTYTQTQQDKIETSDRIPLFREPVSHDVPPEPVASRIKKAVVKSKEAPSVSPVAEQAPKDETLAAKAAKQPGVEKPPLTQAQKTITPLPQQQSVFPWKVAAIIAACGFFAVCGAFLFFGSPAAGVDPQAIYLEAEQLYDEKDMTAALIKYSMVVEQFPQSSLAPFASRRISELQGKMFPTEVEKLEKDIQSQQLFKSVAAAFEKGYISAPENDNVLFYLQKIREVNPSSIALVTWEDRIVAHLKQLANMAYENNQYTTSINYFNTVLSIHPDDKFAQKKIERLYKLIDIRSQRIDSKTRIRTEKPTYKEFALMDDPAPEAVSDTSQKTISANLEEIAAETIPEPASQPIREDTSPIPDRSTEITGFALPVSDFKETSSKRVAEAIVKYAAYERNIAYQTDGVSIFVIGAPKIAEKLRKYIGEPIGNSTLKSVLEGNNVPQQIPEIIFVGDPGAANEVIRYTRRHRILSIAGKPEIIAQGITLGIGASKKKKVEILLNLTAALSEGLDWDPQVMGIAQMF